MSEIVMVPVPVKLLPRVYAVLAETLNKVQEPDSDLEFLSNVFRLSGDDVRQFLLHLAAKPGTWISFQDMARITSGNQNGGNAAMAVKHKLRGTLRSLTTTCKQLRRGEEWPLEWERVDGRIRYRMSKEGAELLNQLAS